MMKRLRKGRPKRNKMEKLTRDDLMRLMEFELTNCGCEAEEGAKILMHIVRIMIKRKVKKGHGDIFLENRKMMQLMSESGFKLIGKEDSFGVRHLVLEL